MADQSQRSDRESGRELASEFGPIAHLMSDPTIEEVWINSPHRIFIARAGVSQLTNVVLSSQEVRDLVERLLMWGGRRLDLSHPFVDARLPDGSRLHVAIPEVTATHWAVNIRKHIVRGKSLKELALKGVMSPEIAQFLQGAVASGMNILVSGSTQAGKTTLLNALVSSTPFRNRVITIEEVFELKPKLPDCIALQTRPANLQGEGEIPLRKLIKEALRMRPSQIVVGEIREAEALDLLIALNSGLPGMATIHANSARDAIAKLQTLPLLAGENISYQFVTPIVASTINLVVHTTILRETGERRVVEIAHVTGRIENDRIEIEPLFTFIGDGYERGLLDPFRLVRDGLTNVASTSDSTLPQEFNEDDEPHRPRADELTERLPGRAALVRSELVRSVPMERTPMERTPMERTPMERTPMERTPMEHKSPERLPDFDNVLLHETPSWMPGGYPTQTPDTNDGHVPTNDSHVPTNDRPVPTNDRPWILPDSGGYE